MWPFAAGLVVFFAGAVLSWLGQKSARVATLVGSGSAVAGSILTLITALQVLVTGREVELSLPWDMPLGRIALAVDPLSAVFLLPIGVVVGVAALYGAQYLHGGSSHTKVGVSWFFFNLLAASMLLVVAARNGMLFLLCWEGMSLASFFLVLNDYEQSAARRAGWVYLAAMHLGTACLLVLFLLLGRTNNSLDFARFTCEGGLAGGLFVLAGIGFGTKAGLIPLHIWLPEAHPAAPAHVSAVMSGVMIKTGIYGFLRTLTFLGDVPAWWGWTLVSVGVVSGVFGVLLALAQHDLKKLLAYCSVENIGIIALGLGVGLLGLAYRLPAMTFLGFTGALLHVLNHALFKSLLFLGAGAIQHGTGTRDMNRLGGLLKQMPVTGATFLLGACAISGLPPWNGFVSELLIYMGVLLPMADLSGLRGGEAVLLCVCVVGGLAFVGGLAAACFTNAFGGIFLGAPRSDQAAHGHEAGLAMRVAMLVLAGCCAGVALTAPLWPRLYYAAISRLVPAGFPDLLPSLGQAQRGMWAVCLAAWVLFLGVGVLAWVRRRLLAGQCVTTGPTWDCGYAAPTARMQYTTSSFASPLLLLFRMFLQPRVDIQGPLGPFPERAQLASYTPDVFHEYMFRPIVAAVVWAATRLRWLQNGRIQLYVLYIALTILVLLVWKLG